jgi:hypothetical protein
MTMRKIYTCNICGADKDKDDIKSLSGYATGWATLDDADVCEVVHICNYCIGALCNALKQQARDYNP